jgi:hypothetical protein
MLEFLFYGIVFMIAVGLIAFRPLSRQTGVAVYWEIGTGTLLILFILFSLTSTWVPTPGLNDDDLAKKPCGTESPQGACYSLEKGLCEQAWANADAGCKAEIASLVRERPSALVGPAMNRCKSKKMDQFLHYNRAKTATPFCKAYFEFIEAR